jgi:hypothetical protein
MAENKQLAPTNLVANPLHQFASWTYNWSLWWLNIEDYKAMTAGGDPQVSLTSPTNRSYVVAQDGGVYPNQRAPSQAGLNYNIQRVDFDTRISSDKRARSSNVTEGTITILEPHGITWLDSLIQLSFHPTAGSGGQYENYTEQPYMLQLDFVGYDDKGEIIPVGTSAALYRKRFPIIISAIKLNVTNKGAEYIVSFKAAGHSAHSNEKSTTPGPITVVAETVQEFFDAFKKDINNQWQARVAKGQQQYADNLDFKIDPEIGVTKIVYDKQMPLGSGDPDKPSISFAKGKFTIPQGTKILAVINKVIAQSSYIVGQLGLDLQSATPAAIETSLTEKLKTFKTAVKVDFVGFDKDGSATDGAFDNILNCRPKRFTYNITQYTTTTNVDPVGPTLADGRPYVIKQYQYTYTGQNIDIINFKLDLSTTYYTQVLGTAYQVASTLATASTGLNRELNTYPQPLLSPQLIASALIPGLTQIPTPTPIRYSVTNNDLGVTTGLGTGDDPAKAKAAKLLKSMEEAGDANMLKIELTIVGDPTLIKQDDWLYTANPENSNDYNNWNVLSNSDFVAKFGHCRMDINELLVEIIVNTPLDIDTDWQGTGLVFPQPGLYRSTFSGLYKILGVKNKFENGKFDQVLSLARVLNSSWITASRPDVPNRLTGGANRTYVVPKGFNAVTNNLINQTNTYTRD